MWDRKAERTAKYNQKKEAVDKKHRTHNHKRTKKITNDTEQNRQARLLRDQNRL